jgi:hypothetical protein
VGVSGSGESMVADCFGDGGDGTAELFEWFGGDHAAVYAAVWISMCVGSVALWGCGDGGIVSEFGMI